MKRRQTLRWPGKEILWRRCRISPVEVAGKSYTEGLIARYYRRGTFGVFVNGAEYVMHARHFTVLPEEAR